MPSPQRRFGRAPTGRGLAIAVLSLTLTSAAARGRAAGDSPTWCFLSKATADRKECDEKGAEELFSGQPGSAVQHFRDARAMRFSDQTGFTACSCWLGEALHLLGDNDRAGQEINQCFGTSWQDRKRAGDCLHPSRSVVPIYKRWWLWTVVGAVVSATAGATAMYYLTRVPAER